MNEHCFEKHSIPKQIQHETKNVNVKSNKEIEYYIIKQLPTRKTPGIDSFPGECYQTLKKKLIHKFHQEIEKRIPHTSFYEVSKTLIPKLDSDITRKVFSPTSLMNTHAKIIIKY